MDNRFISRIVKPFVFLQPRFIKSVVVIMLVGLMIPAAMAESVNVDSVAGYMAMSVDTQTFMTPPDIEEFSIPLMRDPQAEEPPEPTQMPDTEMAEENYNDSGNVRKNTAGDASIQKAGIRKTQANEATATNKTRVLTRIAVVPHDYKGVYGETAFDRRLGQPNCKMRGVYASCVYKKTIEY